MANKSFVVQYLIKAREQYTAAAAKVKAASMGMRESIKKMKKSFIDASAKMRKAGAVMMAGLTTSILFMANRLKNAARDAGETESKFATVFKNISGGSEKAAKELASNFGLAQSKAKELLGDTGDLLSGFGFTQESALNLSTQVNKLAVDLASFTNFSGGAEGASAALTKALLGERESLKSLGIAILEKDVKAKVSQLIAEGHTFATMRQAKAQATLLIALEQSKNAIGDFARTSEDLANQERITAAAQKDLAVSFGKLLIPLSLKYTRAKRALINTIKDFSPEAKKALLVIAGIAAVIGPILLALGSIVLILPALKAGFIALGVIAMPVLAPILVVAGLIAAGAFLIIKNWDKVKAFFKGFADGINSSFGPTMGKLIEDFKEAAAVVVQLFGADSEAARSLTEFSNIGELIGKVIGGALDLIVRGLSGIGSIIGQLLGAIVTLDFSQFDIEAIKAEFTGKQADNIVTRSQVDVGVNVGLDQGLTQTTKPTVFGNNIRRADVGVVSP